MNGSSRPGSRRGPDLLCIGAQKAGTTWLYESLARHRSAWVPPVKEIHFFDLVCANEELLGVESGKWPSGAERLAPLLRSPTPATARWLHRFYHGFPSTDWYYRLFSTDVSGERLTADITPAYSTLDERGVSFARKVLADDCKVLLIVRNPIERFWSSIKMYFRWTNESIEPDVADRILSEARRPGHRLRGDYSTMIRLWEEHFRQHFKIVLYDTLRDEPERFLGEVLSFLDLPRSGMRSTVDERINADPGRRRIPDSLYDCLRELYEPEIAELEAILPGVTDLWLDA